MKVYQLQIRETTGYDRGIGEDILVHESRLYKTRKLATQGCASYEMGEIYHKVNTCFTGYMATAKEIAEWIRKSKCENWKTAYNAKRSESLYWEIVAIDVVDKVG
jgi:hypothetical protein